MSTARNGRNWRRWSHPDLGKIVVQIRHIAFDDPNAIELEKD